MITHEDITELKAVFDDRYVMQSECNEKQERVNKRFSNDDKRIEIIAHDFKVIKWLVVTVAASSISALVIEFLGLIFK